MQVGNVQGSRQDARQDANEQERILGPSILGIVKLFKFSLVSYSGSEREGSQ